MGKNFITAEEAKTLNKTTDKLISQAFKCIKNEAEYGYSEFTFDTYKVAPIAFSNLRDELINAGFKLYFQYINDSGVTGSFQNIALEGKVPAAIKICW